MSRRLVLVTAVLLCGCNAGVESGDPATELIALDREFSSYSAEHGFAEAFAHFAAPDVTAMFSGVPAISGRDEVVKRLADGNYTVQWKPSTARVSGDLGYTTGVYSLIPASPDAAPQHGYYLTVWQRQADGRWLASVDIGNVAPAIDD